MEHLYPLLVLALFGLEAALRLSFVEFYRRQADVRGDYQAARTWLGLSQLAAGTAAVLVLGGGLLARLVEAVRPWAGSGAAGEVVTAVGVSAAVWIGLRLVNLPLQAWGVFGIEQKFGFNRQTVAGFVRDAAVGLAVSLVLTCGLVGGLTWLWTVLDDWFFAVLPAGLMLALWIGEWLSPRFLEPLFNRYRPLEDGPLRQALAEVAERAGIPVQKILVVDTSRRSTHANAWFTGLGDDRRVVLTDNLVGHFPVPEIAAILAHEAGHWRLGHVRARLWAGFWGLALAAAGLWLAVQQRWFDGFFAGSAGKAEAILAAVWLLPVLATVLTPLAAWSSRRQERQADAFAARLQGSGLSLAAALERLGTLSRAIFDPPPARKFYDSHPSLKERIERLRQRAVGRSPAPVLECGEVRKAYAGRTVVDGVSLTLAAGECLAVLGPNGAGKTTLVEILEGLRPAEGGSLKLFGTAINLADERSRPASVQDRLGVQTQENAWLDHLTLTELLQFCLSQYPLSRQTPRALLELVGLEARGGALVKHLSGGQKQRFSLAAALAGDPELLFLDEPTTGLDPQSRRDVWDKIAALKARGLAVLLTTHNMEEAELLGDRVAVMDQGQILALDTPAALKARYAQGETVRLQVEPAEGFAGWAAVLPGVDGVDLHADGRWTLRVRDLVAVLPPLLQGLRDQGRTLEWLEVRHTSLEEVFFALTGKELRE